MTIINLSYNAPKRFGFTCNIAQIEKIILNNLLNIDNSSDINVILQRTFQYFNVSLFYKDILMNKINTYCFSIRS